MSVPVQAFVYFAFYRKRGHIYIYIYIYKYMDSSPSAAGPVMIICLMLRHSAIIEWYCNISIETPPLIENTALWEHLKQLSSYVLY